MTLHDSVLDAIGGTPLIRLNRLTRGLAPRVYVKLESQNIGGSVKDRAALWMIRAAERDGSLRPGGTVVEGTSGNTGIGLALVAAHLGYKAIIVTSSAISADKIRQLTAYGAEVRFVDEYVARSDPRSAASVVERIVAETPGAWRANQYDNPANPLAHVETTGPEIWKDLDGRVTHLVATIGTGGTISGTGRTLKALAEEAGRGVRVIGADPWHSVYGGGDGSPKYVEGAGHILHPDAEDDVWPESFDASVVDEIIRIDDAESIAVVRRAAREEGLLLGGSSGTALAAALRLAERAGADDRIVVLAPDSGRNYLSTYFDDAWLKAKGFSLAEDDSESLLLPRADGGLVLLDHSATVGEANERLLRLDADLDDPALLTFPKRVGDHSLAPLEVTGVVTRRDLERSIDPTVSVSSIAAPPPVVIPGGLDAEAALAHADASRPGWTSAVVLRDGRVVSVVAEDALRGATR